MPNANAALNLFLIFLLNIKILSFVVSFTSIWDFNAEERTHRRISCVTAELSVVKLAEAGGKIQHSALTSLCFFFSSALWYQNFDLYICEVELETADRQLFLSIDEATLEGLSHLFQIYLTLTSLQTCFRNQHLCGSSSSSGGNVFLPHSTQYINSTKGRWTSVCFKS